MSRYSRRLPWSLSSNSLSLLALVQRESEIPLIDLTSANPTLCFSHYPHEAISNAFASLSDFTYDPHPFGLESAREAITRYYEQRGVTVTPGQILLTASTSEAYALLFKLLCDPGDEILVPAPSYPLFEYLAALECVTVQPYRLRYDGAWYLDFADLEKRMSTKTKAIVIVNPNNPTGTFLTVQERARLSDFCSDRCLPLISDEVFMDYALRPRSTIATTLAGHNEVLSFCLNGLSKSAGMPQLKLAWIVVNGSSSEQEQAHERLEILSDTYLSVGTPVQKALPALLRAGNEFQLEIRTRLLANLQEIDEVLEGTAAHRLLMDGGWSAIIQLPRTLSDEEWTAGLLTEQQVLVQPGYFFDMPPESYLVLSLLTPTVQLRKGLNRLKAHMKKYSG